MTNMCHFLIILLSPIVHFLKTVIHHPHKPQCLWTNTWLRVIMTVLHQVMPSTVLQVNRNGSTTVCHNLIFRILLSPLPEQEEILLHHLYDVRMFSHHIQYNTTAAAANAIHMLDCGWKVDEQSRKGVEGDGVLSLGFTKGCCRIKWTEPGLEQRIWASESSQLSDWRACT